MAKNFSAFDNEMTVAMMSKGNSSEREGIMKALSGEVVLINQLPASKPRQVSGEVLA